MFLTALEKVVPPEAFCLSKQEGLVVDSHWSRVVDPDWEVQVVDLSAVKQAGC